MMKLYLIIWLLLWGSEVFAQRKLVVASLESKAPQRDIKVRVDNGDEIVTPWSGEIEVPDSFKRITLSHPRFQHRYVLANELHGDTIYLIPALHAIDEVVVYGQDRRKSMMAGIMMLFEKTVAPKIEAKQRRKRALKVVRQKEQEYEAKWDALKAPQKWPRYSLTYFDAVFWFLMS